MKPKPIIITLALLSGLLAVALAMTIVSSRQIAEQYRDVSAKYANAVSELAAAKAEAALKTLPLKITHRNGLVAEGGVLMIENVGSQAVPIKLEVKRGDLAKRFDLVLNPNITHNIGQLEGWAFAPGDQIEISSDGYKPLHGKYSAQ